MCIYLLYICFIVKNWKWLFLPHVLSHNQSYFIVLLSSEIQLRVHTSEQATQCRVKIASHNTTLYHFIKLKAIKCFLLNWEDHYVLPTKQLPYTVWDSAVSTCKRWIITTLFHRTQNFIVSWLKTQWNILGRIYS